MTNNACHIQLTSNGSLKYMAYVSYARDSYYKYDLIYIDYNIIK